MLLIAIDHSNKEMSTGEWIERTEWLRVWTFQQDLVFVLEEACL